MTILAERCNAGMTPFGLSLSSWPGVESSQEAALRECKFVVEESIKWMIEDGEAVAQPLGRKS